MARLMNVCTCDAKALRDARPSPLDTSESYSIACSAALRTLCKAGTGWRGGGSLAGKLFTNWLFPAIYLLLTVLYSQRISKQEFSFFQTF